MCGWIKDATAKVLVPVMVAGKKPPAPPCVLKLIICSCSSDILCATGTCGCNNMNLKSTIFCKCHQTRNCENKCTLEETEDIDEHEIEAESDIDN